MHLEDCSLTPSAQIGHALYKLFIGNKNYSSWSLRPWLLMRCLSIPFSEELIPFGENAFAAFSPTGKVPCLWDGVQVVWDSLAIIEYLAERHQGVWPTDRSIRAWARSATAEMHAGFPALRKHCTMNVGVRVKISTHPADLVCELRRMEQLWLEGLDRYGGPYLTGKAFTAVDAFYAPMAFRLASYGIVLSEVANGYGRRLMQLEPMQEWRQSSLVEPWRDLGHEAEARAAGILLEDLRSAERAS